MPFKETPDLIEQLQLDLDLSEPEERPVMAWKTFEESRFVVMFTGEAATNEIVEGWPSVINKLDELTGNPEAGYSYENPCWEGHDPDAWHHGDCHADCDDERMIFSEECGETNTLFIVRLFEFDHGPEDQS